MWNILKNCPASQRKSLAGLDNEASKGLDAFDKLITICKLNGTNHTERPVKAITDSWWYFKGDYCIHCSSAKCNGIADHCLKYALSNPKDSNYETKCNNKNLITYQNH